MLETEIKKGKGWDSQNMYIPDIGMYELLMYLSKEGGGGKTAMHD
jgi:hypothetical protein